MAAENSLERPAGRRRKLLATIDQSDRHVLPAQPPSSSWHGRDGSVGVTRAAGRNAGTIATDSTKPSVHVPARLPATEVIHVNASTPHRLEIAARRL